MFILTIHVIIALVMSLAIAVVFLAGVSRRKTGAYSVMIATFAGTLLSGLGLMVLSAGGLGRFCAMMTAFSLATIAAHRFYSRRLNFVRN